jgi:hypothetical protein
MVNRLEIMVRGSLISIIFEKTLDLNSDGLDESSALAMVTTDVETVVFAFEDMHETWGNVVQIAFSIWLLERRITWACVGPVIISIGVFYSVCHFPSLIKLNSLYRLFPLHSASNWSGPSYMEQSDPNSIRYDFICSWSNEGGQTLGSD